MIEIVYKFASRSRPEKFFAALENIRELSEFSYGIIASLDEDDPSCNNETFKQRLKNYPEIIPVWGISNNKVHAINRDLEMLQSFTDYKLLINMSDDMKFIQKGYDRIMLEDLTREFPDTDGFLHYNDGNQGANVSTLSVMGRKWFKRTRTIYNEYYYSVWCDVEETDRAWISGKYFYSPKVMLRHMHPAWGLAETDEQYKKTENPEIEKKDKKTFLRRRSMNYGLKPEEVIRTTKYPNV